MKAIIQTNPEDPHSLELGGRRQARGRL